MNTQQKYEGQPSQTNIVEPTVDRNAQTITLELGTGHELDVVANALMRQRDELIETAAYSLAGQQVDEFLSSMDEIESINQLLDDTFCQLNRQVAALTRSIYCKQTKLDVALERNEKKTEVLQKLAAISERNSRRQQS